MFARLKEYITTQKSMHSQVFLIVLIVGALTALLSTLATVIEGIGPAASIFTLLCFVAICAPFLYSFLLFAVQHLLPVIYRNAPCNVKYDFMHILSGKMPRNIIGLRQEPV